MVNPDDINLTTTSLVGSPPCKSSTVRQTQLEGVLPSLNLDGEKVQKVYYTKDRSFYQIRTWENVKQSNWSSYARFTQTRMGVEQVFVDYFQRAKEYQQEWKAQRPTEKSEGENNCSTL